MYSIVYVCIGCFRGVLMLFSYLVLLSLGLLCCLVGCWLILLVGIGVWVVCLLFMVVRD